MKSEIKYELPMFSSNLENEPEIGFKHTSARFTPQLYGAYDKVVEVIDSEWLEELKNINLEDFSFWKPKHYALYLDGFGLYQFIAQSFEVKK